jgi:Predicted methyltransferase (contains TPR repeat)
MTEYRLFSKATVPDFTTPGFFGAHPWVAPAHQTGHAERTQMTAELIRDVYGDAQTLSDLGCGDGALLAAIRDLPLRTWGYDAGRANVAQAQAAGLDVRLADFLSAPVEFGDLIVMSEVLEHLVDPHGWLVTLPACTLVASTPSSETDQWHYIHHAWAWDEAGFAQMIADVGFRVLDQRTVFGGINEHDGPGEQWFQAIAAVKP